MIKCKECWKELKWKKEKFWASRHSPNFCWDVNAPWDWNNYFFCSDGCRKKWKKDTNEMDKKNIPYLAELDEAMNYCEYFVRVRWNEWKYIRDWFEYEVNWLWDYKDVWYGLDYIWPIRWDFIKAFKEYFWHSDRFVLHNRYKYENK
jgi:hypothetical protein